VDLVLLGAWGVLSGVGYAAIAFRVDRAPRRRDRAQDSYAIGWYGLAATSFLLAGDAAAQWGGADDLALRATLRLGLVLSFVLAIASLLTAGAHFLAAERARRSAVSPRPQG
jgi:MFS family permease